jgi:hypothetical protein
MHEAHAPPVALAMGASTTKETRMNSFFQILEMVRPDGETPRATPSLDASGARRALLAITAFLSALALAAVWGVAAGSVPGHLALDNLIKVPLLLVVSAMAALPLALLVHRLTSSRGRGSDLLIGHALGTFVGALVLALLAPLVALYQHSSTWAGPAFALGSAFLAIAVAFAVFIRILGKIHTDGPRRALVAPAGLLLFLQLAALVQLASITTPIFPQRTTLGHGIDAISRTDVEKNE